MFTTNSPISHQPELNPISSIDITHPALCSTNFSTPGLAPTPQNPNVIHNTHHTPLKRFLLSKTYRQHTEQKQLVMAFPPLARLENSSGVLERRMKVEAGTMMFVL